MESKWKKWIKQFPKLEEAWYQIPEPANTYFTIQIDSFAESENQKLREENERLKNEIGEEQEENEILQSKIKDLEDKVRLIAKLAWNAGHHYANLKSKEDFEEFMKQQGL